MHPPSPNLILNLLPPYISPTLRTSVSPNSGFKPLILRSSSPVFSKEVFPVFRSIAGVLGAMECNLKDTELRLGLPGTAAASRGSKRGCSEGNADADVEPCESGTAAAPPAKAQVVGWPPIRSYRKNSLHQQSGKKEESKESGMYVKVSMDGAPYLRKIDIKGYKGYPDLLKAMEVMFKFTIGDYSEREGYKGSDFVPTYEDKDGDWMLVGDVPWEMFMSSCKRLRIVKGSEAKGLACNI